ncbi:hypothetical protein, partial [Paucilactobacillus nenjiangensis]|uniref:hypothetical protein n=1 Tax=Paucilactobacillus nenjiangensis TaxID=1296540 RepID=UPI003F9C46AC
DVNDCEILGHQYFLTKNLYQRDTLYTQKATSGRTPSDFLMNFTNSPSPILAEFWRSILFF